MPKTSRAPMVLVPARFPPPAAEWIEAHASAEGISESEVLRRAVWVYRDCIDRGVRTTPDTQGER